MAIAGVIAMEPKCIVLDEPTAMLDPNGRKEVLKTVQLLRERKHMTVILITHYMEEVVDADKVYVMDQGTRGDGRNAAADFQSGRYIEEISSGCATGDHACL